MAGRVCGRRRHDAWLTDMARDEFPIAVKAALAKRAGHRCSFPGCDQVTIGPSAESTTATANTGHAAHIAAAAGGPGSRRYDARMNPADRRSIDNGIWCCATHAKLIDTDEVRYSVDQLKAWKGIAERKAQARQAHGERGLHGRAAMAEMTLVPERLDLASTDRANEVVGEGVQNACIQDVWGQDVADAIRDFLVEHARNAFSHGKATRVEIAFEKTSIRVLDDGAYFDISSLPLGMGRGGALALEHLRRALGVGLVSVVRLGSTNNLLIPLVRNPSELAQVNPCTVVLQRGDPSVLPNGPGAFLACGRVFVVVPRYMTFSDVGFLEAVFDDIGKPTASITLILERTSEGVIEFYRRMFPELQIVSWPSRP